MSASLASTPYISFRAITKEFKGLKVISPALDLEVAQHEFVAFLGPIVPASILMSVAAPQRSG